MFLTRIIGILILFASFSCQHEKSEEEFLHKTCKNLNLEYQTSVKRILNTIKESPADNAVVKKKVLILDSLYQETIKRINNPEIDNKENQILQFSSFIQQNLFFGLNHNLKFRKNFQIITKPNTPK